ncbi:MAG TPA: hypothetical protein VK400_03930, partial [Pyrinomonadaceae bacterium]|nr:hypothetical protein [Pyrinomonadaceae bacterium]
MLILLLCGCLFPACRLGSGNQVKINNEMPGTILWAWERGEDLRFLDTRRFGVAFLAQTLVLERDEIVFRPRRQPLELAPNTYAIAVTRIETNKEKNKRPALSDKQKNKIISLIKRTMDLPDVRAVQIDFDVMASERNFYKSLARDLRKNLPENTPLTITALASWCVGDPWFNEMPVDEAVPMAFRMGADDKAIRDFLAKENDWREPLCKGSYGIALDEPLLETKFKPNRRLFIFNSDAKGWKAEDLERLP